MKKFDENYPLLVNLYDDEFFPDDLVDKIKSLMEDVIAYLESGETETEKIQEKLDEMTEGINEIDEENDYPIETIEREWIAEDVEYVLKWFGINIDIEEALRMRDW